MSEPFVDHSHWYCNCGPHPQGGNVCKGSHIKKCEECGAVRPEGLEELREGWMKENVPEGHTYNLTEDGKVVLFKRRTDTAIDDKHTWWLGELESLLLAIQQQNMPAARRHARNLYRDANGAMDEYARERVKAMLTIDFQARN